MQVAQAGTYTVLVTNAYGSVLSSNAVLTVLVPPAITAQPSNQTVVVGASASFNVTATGTSPLAYQWTFGGTNLAGATAGALLLTNVQPAQAGSYAVVVTNVAGSAISAVAMLTVLVPPAIATQPSDQAVVVGTNASFTVTATGTLPLAYQWAFNGTNLPGAVNSALTLTNAQVAQAGTYSVRVTNSYGSVLSSNATLTVLVPPAIATQPSNATVVVGTNASFTVTASGTLPLAYQWAFNGTNLPGAVNSALTLTNVQVAQAGTYSVWVTNSYGSVLSSNATLTVLVPPAIATQPSNETVVVGTNASFTVTASGTLPLAYQWAFNGTNLPGAVNSALTLTNVQVAEAGTYSVWVTNSYGSVLSSNATLTVLVPPAIATQPSNETVVVGTNASFTVLAGGTLPLAYQWAFNGTNLADATGLALLLTDVQLAQAGSYAVVVTNVAGSVTSAPAGLTVLPPVTTIAVSLAGPQISITFPSVVGLNYVLEYKHFLDDPAWTPLPPAAAGTGGLMVLQDTNAPADSRYYRLHGE